MCRRKEKQIEEIEYSRIDTNLPNRVLENLSKLSSNWFGSQVQSQTMYKYESFNSRYKLVDMAKLTPVMATAFVSAVSLNS